jgi:RimJ/RimL family protein N-acetyltransferase
MNDHVLTERLELRAVAIIDAEALFPILSDPDGWWYDPPNRHASIETTRRFAARAAERWAEGLSYWTVRLQGEVIGLGGAQRHRSGTWNLSYRIATSAQGHGYATELGRAAIDAARACDDSVAVIAWAAEHNTPSRRVAAALGLVDRGLRIDANDGQPRIAYSDRDLDDELMPRLKSTDSRRHDG